MTTWGTVSTIKADAADVLRFAAFHLEAGAHRVVIFLDTPNEEAQRALKAHPKCRVALCNDRHWRKVLGRRPVKHQIRQSQNATHAYARMQDVDWLIHIDADEFLVSQQPLTQVLGALPPTIQSARVRPMEALSKPEGGGFPDAFKRFLPNGPDRLDTVLRLYPTFGTYVKGGFVSHVAGKLFVRTGMADMKIRIHNAQQGEVMNPHSADLEQVALAHCHAMNWQDWRGAYDYRHEKGSYRANLAPAVPQHAGGVTLHELFRAIYAQDGEAGLRAFFDEVCADTPEHRARLQDEGLLAEHVLDLDAKMQKHFPEFTNR
ncbi:MAG: glycosyltransferase family 2 protein [Pseudomonadota bacterium]